MEIEQNFYHAGSSSSVTAPGDSRSFKHERATNPRALCQREQKPGACVRLTSRALMRESPDGLRLQRNLKGFQAFSLCLEFKALP
jgi:hypothetical protein